jgi:Flp pilus assembly protein TadG
MNKKKNLASATTRGRKRKGAAVTEFALVAPLIVLITMGAIDAGQAINVAQVISNASREGARQASYSDVVSVGQVDGVVREFIANAFPGIPSDQLSARVVVDVHDQNGNGIASGDLTTLESGSPVTVHVSLQFGIVQLTKFIPGFDQIVVQTTTVMRRE